MKEPRNSGLNETEPAASVQNDYDEFGVTGGISATLFPQGLLQPSPNRKVWIMLIVILVAIGVVILYVYQAGDRKTILGNQPIPAVQSAAFNGQGVAAGQYLCPNCGAVGLPRWLQGSTPVCPRCGSIMRLNNWQGGRAQLAARP